MRKAISYTESIEQSAVIAWARAKHHADPDKWLDLDLIHCSLNGMKMTTPQARRAKAQGMRAGIPDLFLPVPRGAFNGLFLEMKSQTGSLSGAQKEVIARLSALGYCVVVAYGHEEAINAIKAYYDEVHHDKS